MKRIAIMQGYFLPYAGYFRLMCDVDAFVMIDVAQFPRRGWVHRNRLRNDQGNLAWLTLPIAPAPTQTSIADLHYAKHSKILLAKNARRFEATRAPREHLAPIVRRALAVEGTPFATIEALLRATCDLLGFTAPILRWSDLGMPAGLRREDLIYATCAKLGADSYVNAPGGQELYDPDAFAKRGIKLEFLPHYRGDPASILQRLHDADIAEVRAEIRANLL